MAIDLIDLGTLNQHDGDKWRTGGTKINAMFTELFAFKDAQQFIFITKEADFPTQDDTTITLLSNKIYIISSDTTIAKKFTVQDGAVITAFNIFGPTLTYSGSGVMFTGVDVNFVIRDLTVSCSSAKVFDFTDSVGSVKDFECVNVRALACTSIGSFDDYLVVQFMNSGFISTGSGIDYSGGNYRVVSFNDAVFISTSATFKAIDLGSATIDNFEINNIAVIAPSGAYGISGLASSGNINSGFVATVFGSSFSGGMTTPLENITVNDIRWDFKGNNGVADTITDALLSFNGNATETVITTQNVPVIVNATWTVVICSKFTCTTGGRSTSNSEGDLGGVPITFAVGLISAGGGAIDVSVYLAENGSVITASKTTISISGANQAFVSIPWQISTISENDYYEVWVENNTNTTNIIVESAKLRIR